MGQDSWFTLARVFLKHLPRLPVSYAPYFMDKFRHTNPHRHKGRLYLNTFFPPMPSAAFNRFIDAIANNRRVPISTYFAVTERCPYKCPHCSYGCHESGQMDTAEAKDVIGQIKGLGTMMVGFTGGEPMLREDLAELVREVGDDTISVIFTTGHGLDGERAAELGDAGLDCMTIGIESPDEDEHDATRGVAGSFDEALAAIEVSLEGGFYTSISTVGTRDKLNGGKLERLAELATERGVHEFRILEPVPTGSIAGQTSEALTKEESARLAGFHVEWNHKRKGPAVACFAYLESDEMMGCGAGYHHLYVDAVGNVCPCDLTPLSLGNLRDESLAEVWERMGQWFDKPRCGCFSKMISDQLSADGGDVELPLRRDKSEAICTACSRVGELPAVYEKLMSKGGKREKKG